MATRLFIHLPEVIAPDAAETLELDWYLAASDGTKAGEGQHTLDGLDHVLEQNAVTDYRVVVLVPASLVVSLNAKIPGKSARVIQQAMAFAVEEQLADDVEDTHLCLGAALSDGRYAVFGASHEAMSRWMALFRRFGSKLSGIYPDSALLPPAAGEGWTGLLAGESLWLRGPDQHFLRLPMSCAPLVLDGLAGNDEGATVPMHLYQVTEEGRDTLVMAQIQQITSLTLETEALAISPLELFARTYLARRHIETNLCRGEFQLQSEGPGTVSRWKPAIGVAAAWFVLTVGVNIGQGWYFDHKAAAVEKEIMNAYRTAFPDDKRTHAGNLKRVLEGRLREAGNTSQGGFLDLLRLTALQYRGLADRNSISLTAINFSQQRGELVIDVNAPGFPQMDQFKSAIANAGLDAKIGSATQEKDSVKGRISISGGARGS